MKVGDQTLTRAHIFPMLETPFPNCSLQSVFINAINIGNIRAKVNSKANGMCESSHVVCSKTEQVCCKGAFAPFVGQATPTKVKMSEIKIRQGTDC